MNKYQEALDKFKGYKYICIHRTYYEDIDTLQELIDKYSNLEKALDKACSKLYEMNINENIPELNIHSIVYTKKQWKEWLLKDE